jgi:hypothetical protein
MREWFKRLGYNIASSMHGRNGMDTMASWSLGLAIVMIVVAFLFNNGIINTLALIPLVYALFRCYSQNVSARRRENEAFSAKVAGPTRWVELQYKKFKNRKTTCYFTCSECKTVYSVPKGKGKIRATCPKCHKTHEHTT